VLFADFELQAHRLVERGKPVTADVLGEIYAGLFHAYYGDAVAYDELSRMTWARISHFYSTPYYVYQYATCFASSAELMTQLTGGSPAERAAALDRYLTLLRAGGSDHPMTLLQRAGVDLSRPATVRAVVGQLDGLVTQLEQDLQAVA
jgi:oligoendopeptidase F